MADTLTDILLDQIDARKLPLRERLNNIEVLMQSIQRFGLIEPVVVTPSGDGYQLIVGRRRYEACHRLNHSSISAIIRRVSPERAAELSYQSNLQIDPINIADEVDFLRKIEVFHLPDEDAAPQLGMTAEEVAVARRFSRLPPPIREAVRTGEIDERRALALSRLSLETEQTRMFRYIRENDPPVSELETLIDRVRSGEAPYV